MYILKGKVLLAADHDIHPEYCVCTLLQASELVSPAPKTLYQQSVLHQEEQVYRSHQKAPLGNSTTWD